MTKRRLEIQYNVNADKVVFKGANPSKYAFSKENKNGFYIERHDGDNYDVVDGKTNSVYGWRTDLSDLEE